LYSSLAQHRTGHVVGDDQQRLDEVGEEEQLADARQRECLAGSLSAGVPLGDEPGPFGGRLELDFDLLVHAGFSWLIIGYSSRSQTRPASAGSKRVASIARTSGQPIVGPLFSRVLLMQ